MKSEFALIERFKKIIPRKIQGRIPIGDDTALISPGLLFTADTIVEGVDFIHGRLAPELAGRKVVAVNLSDIAAMGGMPTAFVASLGIPKGLSEKWVEKFTRGMARTARQYKTLFVGGDITRAQEFFASIAMVGTAPAQGPLRRSGAKPGDWIGVTGRLGGSIRRHHYLFEPRLAEGRFLASFGHVATIDISDGLAQDLGHILKASRAGAEVEIRQIPVSSGTSLKGALNDGEDFELLFCASESQKKKIEKGWPKKFSATRLSWIGRIKKGKGIRWTDHGRPVRLPFEVKGFRHF